MDLNGKTFIVTGASQGIGKSIAMALAQKGASLCLGSRRPEKIKKIFTGVISEKSLEVQNLDLADSLSIRNFVSGAANRFQHIDTQIHCGGIYDAGRIGEISDSRVSELLDVNVKGSHTLFSAILPFFNTDFSQLVVINSSSAVNAKPETGIFSATSHGLKAITDSFRHENNERRIRVSSLYLGRTATPRMEKIYKKKGLPYEKDLLLQPEDVAKAVLNIISMPETAEVTDLYLRPFIKSY